MLPAFTGHAPCNQCGYDLHGLPLDGNCPECSRPVAISLQGDELRFAATPYLETVSKGLKIYYVTGVVLIAMGVLKIIVGIAAALATGVKDPFDEYFELVDVGLAIAGLVGFYYFTSPDPGRLAVEAPRSARVLARVGLVLSFIGSVSQLFTVVSPVTVTQPLTAAGIVSILVASCSFIGFIMFFFYGLRYTEWVFRRVPDVESVLTCRKYMWLLPLIAILGSCLVVGPLVAMGMHLALLWKLRKFITPILEERRAKEGE
jgi:hypothetical protein